VLERPGLLARGGAGDLIPLAVEVSALEAGEAMERVVAVEFIGGAAL